jgi:PAS domain S-box-containing protein
MSGSIRVLLTVAEDDIGNALATALEDESSALTATVARGASDGLDRLHSGDFDCVVSEYDLPSRTGTAFLETVRERHPGLPFVLFPAERRAEVAAAASAPAVTYVEKVDGSGVASLLANTIETVAGGTEGSVAGDHRSHRLEQILETLPGCVVQLDCDGRFIYANSRAEDVLGLERSAVTKRTYNDPAWEITDPQGDPIPDEELPFRRVLDSGAPLYDYHHAIRWPDGSEKVLSVSGTPLFDGRGTVESVVFSLSDITERKRKEWELERYQQIVDHLDDIATIVAPDGTIEFVSPAVERILGYEPSEVIGENGFGYQPPETSQAVADAIEDTLADPAEPHTVQTKFRRADGTWAWIESTLRDRTDDDVIDGILVSSREITERRESKDRIRERERQLSKLHEATRDLLGSETPQEVARTASRTAVDILDFRLNGIHFYDESVGGLAPTAVSDGSKELFGEVPVIDGGIAWNAFQRNETRIYNDIDDADDVYNPESAVRSEIHIPLGDYGVFLISATERDAFEETDIELARILAANTEAALERIGKEQQLRDRESDLETQNERLEEFANIVSHDLRNPLNVAQIRAELLADEQEGQHLPAIRDALDRIEQIVSDTLTLARNGAVIADPEPIAVADLASRCWDRVATADATIEVVDEVTIHGDRSRVQNLFENLFRNAVEHGGTETTVRIGRIDGGGIYVEDTGPGIPEADRETVFEPGETSTSGGTGFGLAIVRRIAEAHGWDVALVEGAAGGARFEFTGPEPNDG